MREWRAHPIELEWRARRDNVIPRDGQRDGGIHL